MIDDGKGKPDREGDDFLEDLEIDLDDTVVMPGKGEKAGAPKKPVAKKPAAKKPVAKKPAPKKPVAKKPAAKKPAAKKPAEAKKPVAAKKPAPKKPPVELGDETKEHYAAVVSAETREYQVPDSETSEHVTQIAAAGGGFGAGDAAGDALPGSGGPSKVSLWLRFTAAAFLIVVSVAAATSVTVLRYFSDIASALGQGGGLSGLDNQLANVDGGAPQTILLIGSDLRPEYKKSEFRGLSDTMMLLRIDPDKQRMALLSFPRDLQVSVPGYGTGKINEAYAYGGTKLTLRTLRELTRSSQLPDGLPINHVVNVDFEGFARAVNSIGCVFVDVDHRYYHSNDNTTEDYEEIDLQPGYQPLCGFNALDFARYRHTDNDLVRAARQQEFLREARNRVPPETLFSDRKELVSIFTEHTSSDVDSVQEMIQLLKLVVEARSSELRQVELPVDIGPSFVYASDASIQAAVDQLLGLKGKTLPAEPPKAEKKSKPAPAKPKKSKPRKIESLANVSLEPTSYGKVLVRGLFNYVPSASLPLYYPTVLPSGSDFAQKPRGYEMNHVGPDAPPRGQRASYKWVFSYPGMNEYYGFQGTAWKNPPILQSPSEERTFGGQDYMLFYDGGRLRLVAWKNDEGSFWVSNTLTEALSSRAMIEIARGMREYKRPGAVGK